MLRAFAVYMANLIVLAFRPDSFRNAWRRSSWATKLVIIIYGLIYCALISIYIPLCAVGILIYWLPVLQRLRSEMSTSADSGYRNSLDYPPAEAENLQLAREILSYCNKVELEDIVISALAEKPKPILGRILAIIKGGNHGGNERRVGEDELGRTEQSA